MPRKNEDERLKELCRIEREYWNKGILPGGMDEVGRGLWRDRWWLPA